MTFDGATIDVILRILGILFILYFVWKMFSPFRCSCGRIFWSGHRLARHLGEKHLYNDPRKH